jgi:hypothetical protein
MMMKGQSPSSTRGSCGTSRFWSGSCGIAINLARRRCRPRRGLRRRRAIRHSPATMQAAARPDGRGGRATFAVSHPQLSGSVVTSRHA